MGVVVGGGACLLACLNKWGRKKDESRTPKQATFSTLARKKSSDAHAFDGNFRRPTLDPKSLTADPSRKPGDWWGVGQWGAVPAETTIFCISSNFSLFFL
ncbi:MAG: hypothetical protein Q8P67_20995 [archaeon]|nr:hypothetical protein [archaeon]